MGIEIIKAIQQPGGTMDHLSCRLLDTGFEHVDPLRHEIFLAKEGEQLLGVIAESGAGRISEFYIDPSQKIDKLATLLLDRMVCALKMKGEDILIIDGEKGRRSFFIDYGFRQEQGRLTYCPKEIFDVLDHKGELTGRFAERGRKLDRGDYHLVVHVWKHNKQGQWLIDRRSFHRGSPMDGLWETTGGAAVAGDQSLDAALRETKEELGIELDPAKGHLFERSFRHREDGHGWIQDVWIFEWDGSLEDIRFQIEETCDAKWADFQTISRMMASGIFLSEHFYPYYPSLKMKMED